MGDPAAEIKKKKTEPSVTKKTFGKYTFANEFNITQMDENGYICGITC